MKIKRLVINNCLGIKELQMDPRKINMISGGNEKGKTSILECIEKAVNNSERRAKFVKTGEEEATLFVTLDDGTEISRKIKPAGSESVKVTNNGATIKKPETYLKSLVGGFTFNPVDFIQKKDKEQSDILLSLIPLRITKEMLIEWFGEVPEVNLDQHAVTLLEQLAEHYYYDRRTIANTKVKECQGEIASIAAQLPNNYNADDWRTVSIAEQWREVDKAKTTNDWIKQAHELINGKDATISSISDKYELKVVEADNKMESKINDVKMTIEGQKNIIINRINSSKEKIEEYKNMIIQLENQIKMEEQELKSLDEKLLAVKTQSIRNERDIEVKAINEAKDKEIAEFNNRVVKANKYLEENKLIDVEPLIASAEETEKMKGFIGLYDKLTDLRESLIAKQDTAERLNKYVEIARKKPAELLKNIKLPVTGLGINDEMQLTIDDLPIRNLSTSRQIKLALDIAKATCGPLQLICVDRFESLDAEQRKIFSEEIEKDDFQYFITNVTSGELKINSQEVKND